MNNSHETAQPSAGQRTAARIEHLDDQVACLWINSGDGRHNVLDRDAMEAIGQALDRIEQDANVRAAVIMSDKPGSFIAGADIQMLMTLRGQEAQAVSEAAQKLTNRTADFAKPIVAAIDGPCMGAGLELALACSARIASDDRRTRFAQPEVQLGLIPGAGGTQRLPRLIGLAAAVDMMVTGRKVDVSDALELGLIDQAVPQAILREVARKRAAELCERGDTRRKLDKLEHMLSPSELGRKAVASTRVSRELFHRQILKRVRARTHGNAQAPERLLDVVQTGMAQGFAAGLKAEREAFGQLASEPEAAHLMWLFRTRREANHAGKTWNADRARPLSRVGVIGAGLMGAGIAYVTALRAGATVRLRDRDDDQVLSGLRQVRGLVDAQIERRRMRPHEGEALMHRICGTTRARGFERCDLMIEAVPEVLELKQQMLRELESLAQTEMIFASNTSSIPIAHIAEHAQHPERVIGMHYFSPVERMPLLELVVTDKTAPWVTASCAELGKRQGQTVVVVRDAPGFYTTRVVAALLFEAAELLREGVPIDRIDASLRDFGFPVGPFKLMDEIGLDVIAKISDVLVQADEQRFSAPFALPALADDGRSGRKNGRGFYSYAGGGAEVDRSVYELLEVAPSEHVDPQQITQRCVLRMVNEAIRCREEEIIASPRDGDLAAVLGLGFPPFLGGPFRFSDSVGARWLLDKLTALESRHGRHFAPARPLSDLANSGRSFYDERKEMPATFRKRLEAA